MVVLKRYKKDADSVELIIDADSHVYNGGESGSCFGAAFVMAVRFAKAGLDQELFRICHGVVSQTDMKGNRVGNRMLHAWVEIKIDGAMWMVADASSPNQQTIVILRAAYYAIGQICHADVQRYSAETALEFGLISDHCGPWHRPVELPHDWNADDEKIIEQVEQNYTQANSDTPCEAKQILATITGETSS